MIYRYNTINHEITLDERHGGWNINGYRQHHINDDMLVKVHSTAFEHGTCEWRHTAIKAVRKALVYQPTTTEIQDYRRILSVDDSNDEPSGMIVSDQNGTWVAMFYGHCFDADRWDPAIRAVLLHVFTCTSQFGDRASKKFAMRACLTLGNLYSIGDYEDDKDVCCLCNAVLPGFAPRAGLCHACYAPELLDVVTQQEIDFNHWAGASGYGVREYAQTVKQTMTTSGLIVRNKPQP